MSMKKAEAYQKLFEKFLDCVQANQDTLEHIDYGKKFNRAFEDYVRNYPEESASSFAVSIANLGLVYEEVLNDVFYVRSLGM